MYLHRRAQQNAQCQNLESPTIRDKGKRRDKACCNESGPRSGTLPDRCTQQDREHGQRAGRGNCQNAGQQRE
jgi:hypothetical protein